jgi:competence protein ComEC
MNLTDINIPASRSENLRMGKIGLIPEEKEKTCKIVLGNIKEKSSGYWYAIEGKILLYVEKSTRINELKPGDWVIFCSSLQLIERPSGPMGFDFNKYCKNNGIFWKAYLKNQQWKHLGTGRGGISLADAEKMRMKMIRFMSRNNFKHESLICSILLGYREDLSDSQQKYFSASGAMHVLAVSGLHVGIIYGMLVFIIRIVSRKKTGPLFLFPLLLIWLYALVTGMTPSVTRASLMITLYVISKSLHRRSGSLNIIFCSGFILILVQPPVIHQVSFQLSFAAITGISIVYNGLYRTIRTGYRLPDQVISITCLSIAAQLFTFPLSMFYFHLFPNYFLITNLFAIPLVTLILIAGLIYCFLAFNFTLSSVIGIMMDKLAGCLDGLTRTLGSLPSSSSEDIYIEVYEVVFIYGLILCLILFFYTRKINNLYFSLLFAIMICTSVCFNKLHQSVQKEFTVLMMERTTALNLISGSQNYLMILDTSVIKRSRICAQCMNYWNSKGLTDPEIIDFFNKSYYSDNQLYIRNCQIHGMIFAQFRDLKFGVLYDYYRKDSNVHKLLDLDILIISSIHSIDLSGVWHDIKPGLVIIDGRLPEWSAEKIEMQCRESGIPFHNIRKSGYLNLEL